MKDTKNVRVSVAHKRALDKLKVHPRETYDDIIEGLLLIEKRTRKVQT
jgi:argininosuccinate lyase